VVADDVGALHALRRLHGLALDTDQDGEPAPCVLPLATDAQVIFETWWKANPNHDAQGRFANWRGKTDGMVLRLALTLENLWWSIDPITAEVPPAQINKEAILAAIHLIDDYFAPMTVRCYGDGAHRRQDASALALAWHILATKPERMNARLLYKNHQVPGLKDSITTNRALRLLEDARWIRSAPSRSGSSKGRVSQDFAVNPRLITLQSAPNSDISDV